MGSAMSVHAHRLVGSAMLSAYFGTYRDEVLDNQPTEPSELTRDGYGRLVAALQRDRLTLRDAFGTTGWRPDAEHADPYPTDREMRIAAYFARDGAEPYRVSDTEHNGAFLQRPEHNLLFRAHHDAVHIVYPGCVAFDLVGEALTAYWQRRVLKLAPFDAAAAVLYGEVVGQGLAHRETGAFPLTDAGRQPTVTVTPTLMGWAASLDKTCGRLARLFLPDGPLAHLTRRFGR